VSLLELLGNGLDYNVGETLGRFLRARCIRPHAQLTHLANQHEDWPDVQYELGLSCLHGPTLDEAAEHLSRACRYKPDYVAARLALASAHDEQGLSGKALDQLRIANEVHPGAPEVLFAMGYCLEKLARPEDAAECYRDALAARADLTAARQRLAAIALAADRVDEAIDQYEALRELTGEDPAVLAALAQLYHRAGRYAEAVATYETVIALEPDNWALVDDEVESLVQDGRLREAIERLYHLIDMQGPFADLHLRLAELLSKTGQDAEATRHYLAALENDPNYLEGRIGLGTHHLANGRWEEAAESFCQEAELNDAVVECYLGLGVAQAAQDRWPEAVNTLQLAAAVEPNTTVLLSEMAKLQLKAAVAAEAEAGFEVAERIPVAEAELDHDDLLEVQIARHAEAVAEHPEYADAHYRFGVLLRAQGRLGEAAEQFEQALAIHGAYVPAIIRLGMTQQELGRLEEAVETYRRALELRPRYVDVHYRLALLHTDRKQFSEAVEHMERAADLAPGNMQIRASLALSLQNLGLMDRAAAAWRSLARLHQASRQKGQ
jgi:tetratricopeptide (TPR) repeat protein